MRVGVPALCGALNRGPFVVDEEREGGRETRPGGCVETVGRAATPNGREGPTLWTALAQSSRERR